MPDNNQRQKMIMSYYPMVRKIAYRMAKSFPSHVEVEDLINIGLVGLIEAVDRFHPERTPSFATYARIRVQGAILDEMRYNDWVPRSVRDRASQIAAAKQELQKKLGRTASLKEIADFIGISEAEAQRMYQKSDIRIVLSFEEGSDAEQRLGDIIPGQSPSPLENVKQSEEELILKELINKLPAREQQIVTMYYYKDLTFKEIAQLLGVTESRISQIHNNIKKKVRMIAEKQKLSL